jgi:hypothetical protein
VSAQAILNAVNVQIRELLRLVSEAKRGTSRSWRSPSEVREQLLRLVDELENRIDEMFLTLAPERITDERFAAASQEVKALGEKLRALRESVVSEKYENAEKALAELQSSVRSLYRLMLLIKAGAPVPLTLQLAPTAPFYPPEVLLHTNPLALQAYNFLARRGSASLQDLISELRADAASVTNAVNALMTFGYAKLEITPDGRWVLRAVR